MIPLHPFCQSSSFFIPNDESFCILLDSSLEQKVALDTSSFEEYYLFKKGNTLGELEYFFVIQRKAKTEELSLVNSSEALIKYHFSDFELNNFKRYSFKGKDGFLFDSPYKGFPQYTSRGMVLELNNHYFILLFTYSKDTVSIDEEFEKLLDSMLIK